MRQIRNSSGTAPGGTGSDTAPGATDRDYRAGLLAVTLATPFLLAPWMHRGPVTDYRTVVCGLELSFILAYLAGRRAPLPLILGMGGRASLRATLSRGRDAPESATLRAGSPTLWIGGAWVVWSLWCVALSAHPVPALGRQAEWFCHGLFGLTLWSHLLETPRRSGWIAALIPAGFVLAGLRILYKWYTLEAPQHYNWHGSPPGFSHIRHVGYFALAGFLYSLYAALTGTRSVSKRGLAFCAMSFCLAFLFWAGGRGALVAAVLGMAAILLLATREQRRRLAAMLLATTVLGLGWASLYKVDHIEMGVLHALARTGRSGSLTAVLNGRAGIWRAAMASALDHPLTGLGPDGYLFITPKLFGVHPHNFLVQCAVEWGLVGCLLFLVLMGYLGRGALQLARAEVRSALQLARAEVRGALQLARAEVRGTPSLSRAEPDGSRRAARLTAIGVIVAYTANGLVDGLFYHAVPLMLLAASFAMALQPLEGARPAVPSVGGPGHPPVVPPTGMPGDLPAAESAGGGRGEPVASEAVERVLGAQYPTCCHDAGESRVPLEMSCNDGRDAPPLRGEGSGERSPSRDVRSPFATPSKGEGAGERSVSGRARMPLSRASFASGGRVPAAAVLAAALVVALVLAGQHAVIRILKDRQIPGPLDVKALLVWHYPASTYRLERWLDAWRARDPDAALRWAHWGHSHSSEGWRYFSLEAELLAARGELEAARQHAAAAVQAAPTGMAKAVRERHARLLALEDSLETPVQDPGPDRQEGPP